MKNIINYYYDLNILNVYNINNKYYFNYNNEDYFFIAYNRPLNEVQSIFNLNVELKKRNVLTNSIILNKDNQIITFIDNVAYIMIRDDVKTKPIDMNDILYIQNNTFNIFADKKLYRNDWIKMWQEKIDYYEEQIAVITNNYRLLRNYLDFYIGIGENAISYLVNNKIKDNRVCLSHKRIDNNKNTFDFFNPVNYILDNRIRDFSEYIKNLFFSNGIDFNTFKYYLDYMNYTREEYILLMSRMLFPTYFFDTFDLILSSELKEDLIKPIIKKTNDYISFVKNTFIYIVYQKGINIPFIEWIIKDAN